MTQTNATVTCLNFLEQSGGLSMTNTVETVAISDAITLTAKRH